MKKSILSKITAVFLSLVMALGICLPVTAASSNEVTPVIVVSGMGSFPLYLSDEEGGSEQVFGPSAESILKLVAKCIVPLGKTAVHRDWSYFVDGVTEPAYELFKCLACNPDGSSVYDISTNTFSESVENYPDDFENSKKNDDEIGMIKGLMNSIGGENVYFFNYDWRLSPLEHADALKAFIDNVLEEKNCSGVTLVPASMGGCVTMSYLYKYGSDHIKSIVMTETAVLGTSVAGELFNRNITVNTRTLLEYFYTFYQDDGFIYQTLFGLLASCVDLSLINVEATLDNLFNSLVLALSNNLYDEVLIDTFGTMPGIWALIPNSYYESAKTSMYPDGMNSELMAVTDEYQNNVQCRAQQLLKRAMYNGTDIYFIASYGFVSFPAIPTALNQSDCLIDTCYESFGATCAVRGETFGTDYAALGTACGDAAHNHVSTDGIIDASTCLFPEQTWFIKGNRHVGLAYGTGANDLLVYLATAEDYVDVHTDSNYPQFTKLNRFSGKLTSLTGDTITESVFDKNSDVLTRLLTLLTGIVEFIRNLIGR